VKARGQLCVVCNRPGAIWRAIDGVQALCCDECEKDRYAREEAKRRSAR